MSNSVSQPKKASYGLWKSSVQIESLMDQPSPPAYPFKFDDKLYWLEALSKEKGRIALMQESNSDSSICITPKDFNIRTKVHEYGGKCFCLVGRRIIFNNYKDGSLYHQALEPNSKAQSLTKPNLACCGYADLITTPDQNFVIAVMEKTEADGPNQNCLVAIAVAQLEGRSHLLMVDSFVLAQGADFYANPTISPDGKNLAWFEWDHPNMPWDQSRLVCAKLSNVDNNIVLEDVETVVDELNRSVCQLGYLSDQSFIFASDSDACDYWNLFKYDQTVIVQLTNQAGEFGEPHWIFGQRRWQAVDRNTLIATVTKEYGDELIEVNVRTGDCTVLHQDFSACSHLQSTAGGELLFIGHYTDRPTEIVSLSLESGLLKTLKANKISSDDEGYSEPRLVRFPTGENDSAYGYFYPPYNSNFTAPCSSLPPLLILVHGGPTSKSTSELVSLKQYYCSLGYALLDVNHRGSTGHGRKYRQSLLGHWGDYDADDIYHGIKYVVAKGWADGGLVFIRGGSAGGYAVLRSLTRFPKLFAAGACYYGIGNLITLSEITHKFESNYTDQLLGEVFDPIKSQKSNSRFVTRSPIFQIEQLSSPLIMFQGEQDKVVPPGVSRELVKRLKAKGIKHSYTEYPDEGHGFRQSEARIDSLKKETAFFAEIIKQKLDSINLIGQNTVSQSSKSCPTP